MLFFYGCQPCCQLTLHLFVWLNPRGLIIILCICFFDWVPLTVSLVLLICFSVWSGLMDVLPTRWRRNLDRNLFWFITLFWSLVWLAFPSLFFSLYSCLFCFSLWSISSLIWWHWHPPRWQRQSHCHFTFSFFFISLWFTCLGSSCTELHYWLDCMFSILYYILPLMFTRLEIFAAIGGKS